MTPVRLPSGGADHARAMSTTSARRREVLTFLAVGGAGYVVDVVAFNLLRSQPVLAAHDPTISKVLAVAVAMGVTYLGNRMLTWRDQPDPVDSRRQVALFVLFNVIGLGISVVLLLVTHDLLGLTSRLADNLSANVVGLGLGTAFRYWSYRRFVFAAPPGQVDTRQVQTSLRRSATAAPTMPATTQATITASPVQGARACGAARLVEKL